MIRCGAPGLMIALAGLAQRLTFEVASIKPTMNGPMSVVPRRSGDLVMMHNTQPYSVIYYAYRLRGNYQMVGYVQFPGTRTGSILTPARDGTRRMIAYMGLRV